MRELWTFQFRLNEMMVRKGGKIGRALFTQLGVA